MFDHLNGVIAAYPHVWSLVEGPKSEYIPSLSASHIVRSLLPKYGREQSLSSNPITSAPENSPAKFHNPR